MHRVERLQQRHDDWKAARVMCKDAAHVDTVPISCQYRQQAGARSQTPLPRATNINRSMTTHYLFEGLQRPAIDLKLACTDAKVRVNILCEPCIGAVECHVGGKQGCLRKALYCSPLHSVRSIMC